MSPYLSRTSRKHESHVSKLFFINIQCDVEDATSYEDSIWRKRATHSLKHFSWLRSNETFCWSDQAKSTSCNDNLGQQSCSTLLWVMQGLRSKEMLMYSSRSHLEKTSATGCQNTSRPEQYPQGLGQVQRDIKTITGRNNKHKMFTHWFCEIEVSY